MKFRDDIDIANTWVVSDTHFGHENIVGFCHRPEDHEQVMIAEWRKEVPDDATVLHLGDLAYKGNARFKHLTSKELTGSRKLLIKGNHDRGTFKFYKDCGFKLALPFAIPVIWQNGEVEVFEEAISIARMGEKELHEFLEQHSSTAVVSFSHYPWGEPDDEGEMLSYYWRMHGHIHNNGYTRDGFVPFIANHVNLSVEQTKYKPVNLKALLDGVLAGHYPATTDEQLAEARRRKEERKAS